MARCEICGENVGLNPQMYVNHYKRFHSNKHHVIEAPKILPTRTTNRSKIQIIHDVEKTWGSALFPQVKPWHSVGDR